MELQPLCCHGGGIFVVFFGSGLFSLGPRMQAMAPNERSPPAPFNDEVTRASPVAQQLAQNIVDNYKKRKPEEKHSVKFMFGLNLRKPCYPTMQHVYFYINSCPAGGRDRGRAFAHQEGLEVGPREEDEIF